MQSGEAQRNLANHRSQFIAARDSRNRRVPGLYVRNDRSYAQLWVDLGNGKNLRGAFRFAMKQASRCTRFWLQRTLLFATLRRRSNGSRFARAR